MTQVRKHYSAVPLTEYGEPENFAEKIEQGTG